MALDREQDGPRQYVLPTQGRGVPLQVVRWSGKRTSIAAAGTSTRVPLPANSFMVELAVTDNCYIAFGDVTVVAVTGVADDASRLFLAGVQVVPVPLDPSSGLPYAYIAAIQDALPAVLQIERVE